MDFEELTAKANELAEEALDEATRLRPEKLGIDRRACYTIWRGSDFLAINKSDKGPMNYYGGFEYVDISHVLELGHYIFYSTESSRVLGHWEQAEERQEAPLCPSCNGSGEGMHEGTRCSRCHGQGTLKESGDE